MDHSTPSARLPRHRSPWRDRSTVELVREIASKTTTLASKEIALARTEIKNDVAAELAAVKSFAVAAVAGLLTACMLLVAAAFALATVTAGWLAALAIAGGTFLVAAVAALIGWRSHVARPLDRTRKTLKEDLEWAKHDLM